MENKLIGYPSSKVILVIANEIFKAGLKNCDEAEAKGWLLTDDLVIRTEVDEMIKTFIPKPAKYLILLLALFAIGCGSADGLKGADKSQSGAAGTQSRSYWIASTAGLPTCNGAQEGALAYVASEKTFYACTGGSWGQLVIKGDPGKDGVSGKDGTNGKDGAAGTAGAGEHITGTIACLGLLGTTAINVQYMVAVMTSGDIFATANIQTAASQVSSTEFYSAKQVGAATASVFAMLDVEGAANAGFFEVSLDRTTLITTVKYTDFDGNMAWTMTPDKCTVNKF